MPTLGAPLPRFHPNQAKVELQRDVEGVFEIFSSVTLGEIKAKWTIPFDVTKGGHRRHRGWMR